MAILDVGGTEEFWVTSGMIKPNWKITLLNLTPVPVSHPALSAVTGDARDLSRFTDKTFDLAFSNSVIEHVGGYEDQQRMAAELTRVARAVFVQTPAKFFPIEPHFVFPFFNLLPRPAQRALLMHGDVGHFGRRSTVREADEVIDSIRLLTYREVRALFPGTFVHRERVFGITKSFIATSLTS